MASIRLRHAGVSFPLYSDSALSLRSWMFRHVLRRRMPDVLPRTAVALRDLSLEFNDGDRVGLLGLNGAGKSTLLRLLAGIYAPESGTVERDGGVSTLFDLYLGMDEEASGYENIYIAGALLGLHRAQIRDLVPDVEQFTELGQNLHRPVKGYSAGMRVRLAFAIATSLHSDIMLIDEIIGVGDGRFLKRAKTRLAERIYSSKIMVLASHDQSVLRDFCNRGLVLDQGSVACYSGVDEAIDFYNQRLLA